MSSSLVMRWVKNSFMSFCSPVFNGFLSMMYVLQNDLGLYAFLSLSYKTHILFSLNPSQHYWHEIFSEIFTIRKQNIFCISFKDVSNFLSPVGCEKKPKLDHHSSEGRGTPTTTPSIPATTPTTTPPPHPPPHPPYLNFENRGSRFRHHVQLLHAWRHVACCS